MDHLNHLKLPWGFISAKTDVWSMLVDHCAIKTISLCCSHAMDSQGFILFLSEKLPHLKYVESLVVEPEIFNFHFDEQWRQISSRMSKLKTLSIKLLNLESNQYTMLFQMVSAFWGLTKLHLYLRIVNFECEFNETDFVKAKNAFMKSHPHCEVYTYISHGRLQSCTYI